MKSLRFLTAFLLISIFLLDGCAVMDTYESSVYSIDLSKFEKQGIFVTTGDLSQKYTSVSILVVNCYNGYIPKAITNNQEENKKEKIRHEDDLYADDEKLNNPYKFCSLDDLIDELIRETKNIGANGLIKLEIRNVNRPGVSNKEIQRGIEITGLAVRIE
jgi:hypothetical protein